MFNVIGLALNLFGEANEIGRQPRMPHLSRPLPLLCRSDVGSDYGGRLYRAQRDGGAYCSPLEAARIGVRAATEAAYL
jgi:hypothetical protein